MYSAGQAASLYVDGILIERNPLTSTLSLPFTGATLGAWQASPGRFVRLGALSLRDLRIWDYARDGADACIEGATR